MNEKELNKLMKRAATDKDIEALVELISYLIELDRDIQQKLDSLKQTVEKTKGKERTTYIA